MALSNINKDEDNVERKVPKYGKKGKLARKVTRSPVESKQTQTHRNLRYFGDVLL